MLSCTEDGISVGAGGGSFDILPSISLYVWFLTIEDLLFENGQGTYRYIYMCIYIYIDR